VKQKRGDAMTEVLRLQRLEVPEQRDWEAAISTASLACNCR